MYFTWKVWYDFRMTYEFIFVYEYTIFTEAEAIIILYTTISDLEKKKLLKNIFMSWKDFEVFSHILILFSSFNFFFLLHIMYQLKIHTTYLHSNSNTTITNAKHFILKQIYYLSFIYLYILYNTYIKTDIHNMITYIMHICIHNTHDTHTPSNFIFHLH